MDDKSFSILSVLFNEDGWSEDGWSEDGWWGGRMVGGRMVGGRMVGMMEPEPHSLAALPASPSLPSSFLLSHVFPLTHPSLICPPPPSPLSTTV